MSIAGRFAVIQDLLNPPIWETDVEGNDFIVGYGAPLITKKEARRLMDASDEEIDLAIKKLIS